MSVIAKPARRTDDVKRILKAAQSRARELRHEQTNPAVILRILLEDEDSLALDAIKQTCVPIKMLVESADRRIGTIMVHHRPKPKAGLSAETGQMLNWADEEAGMADAEKTDLTHLLIAMVRHPATSPVFAEHDITVAKIREAVKRAHEL